MNPHQPNPDWTDPVANPQSFEDARANLDHTLQVFGDDWDGDRMLVVATSNVYGPGIKTGLTVNDLRLIAAHVGVAMPELPRNGATP